MLLTAPLVQGTPDPMRAVWTPQREGDRGFYSRETSFLGSLVQCRDWADTRGKDGTWVGGSSESSQCSLGTQKSLGMGVGLDGAGVGTGWC